MFFFASALPLPAFAQSSAAPAKADAVEYHATIDNAKYVFGVAPPVAHVKAGNILEANSLDCFGNALQKQSSELRSEEHTSELQSLTNLVCRLLLEKKKQI